MAKRRATKIARDKTDPRYYADRLARLRTVYTPSFRATKRFTPQQKAAITRKWRDASTRARAVAEYRRGYRVEPPKEKQAPGKGPRVFPKKFRELKPPKKRLPVPKKPPRVRTAKVRDTTFSELLRQPAIKAFNAVRSAARRGNLVRVIRRVPKSKNYPSGLASSEWHDFMDADDETIADALGALGEIAYVAAAKPADVQPGAKIRHV